MSGAIGSPARTMRIQMKPVSAAANGRQASGKAMLAWLKKGKGHAALDVYDREPLPARHPLRRLRNVKLSPHLGYVNGENYRTFHRDTVENVAAWLAGKPIRILQP